MGAPVVSVMPAAAWGPHDPHFGEGVTFATNVLKKRYPIVMPGGMHIADVRDVASVPAAVMAPGHGARRYMVTGHIGLFIGHDSLRDFWGPMLTDVAVRSHLAPAVRKPRTSDPDRSLTAVG
jgi:nucleoside-diphosphate-sugar epimerase